MVWWTRGSVEMWQIEIMCPCVAKTRYIRKLIVIPVSVFVSPKNGVMGGRRRKVGWLDFRKSIVINE